MAEIVREVTDDGRLIAEFYLGVADGSLEGFEDRHRMSAARRLDKIAPGLVARYLQKYYNAQCRPSYRGTSVLPVRRSPIRSRPPERSDDVSRGPNPFRRRLQQLVREETGDGRAIVYFMAGVMHGTLLGFKPHHRMEAAKELSGYITNDNTPVVPAKAEPAPYSIRGTQRGGAGRGSHPNPAHPEPGSLSVVPEQPETQKDGTGHHTVVPEKSETQKDGTGHHTAVPEKSGTHPVPSAETPSVSTRNPEPETKNPPSAPSAVNPKPKTRNFPPITIEEIERANYDSRHITRCKFARDEITGAVYAFDEQGPFEVDEDGVSHYISPDLIVGHGNAYQTFDDTDLEDRLARKRSGMRLIVGPPHESPRASTKNSKPETGNSPQLTPTERRIREKLKEHWYGPDPSAAPLDSMHPGRSPPW